MNSSYWGHFHHHPELRAGVYLTSELFWLQLFRDDVIRTQVPYRGGVLLLYTASRSIYLIYATHGWLVFYRMTERSRKLVWQKQWRISTLGTASYATVRHLFTRGFIGIDSRDKHIIR